MLTSGWRWWISIGRGFWVGKDGGAVNKDVRAVSGNAEKLVFEVHFLMMISSSQQENLWSDHLPPCHMTEGDWKRLLRQIRGGYVVPVLGSELLAGPDGMSTLLRVVSERLLTLHEIPLSQWPPMAPFHELNAAVSLILAQGRVKAQALYVDVADLFGEAAQEPGVVPTALAQLAEITDFRLFVTMTCDTLLAGCLRQRRVVREVIHAPKLPSDEWQDLPLDWISRPGDEAHVLYMFGKARAAPVFAIHDEDVLEYAHNIMARGSNVPINFLKALQDRSLLLLGCGLPDWLGRFFLRLTNKDRLSEKTRHEWLIEAPRQDGELAAFLKSFSGDTECLQLISPVNFVAELHQRWSSEQSKPAEVQPLTSAPQAVPHGAVFFISYSRNPDAPRAMGLYQALRNLGAADSEIWFDRNTIEPGQEFGREILDGIRSCQYFLPLLSDGAARRPEAFVFDEWKTADERLRRMNRTFVVPLIVDTQYQPASFSNLVVDWNRLDFGFAPDGAPDARTLALLKDLLRTARNPARA